jgi:hypothetical protein
VRDQEDVQAGLAEAHCPRRTGGTLDAGKSVQDGERSRVSRISRRVAFPRDGEDLRSGEIRAKEPEPPLEREVGRIRRIGAIEDVTGKENQVGS